MYYLLFPWKKLLRNLSWSCKHKNPFSLTLIFFNTPALNCLNLLFTIHSWILCVSTTHKWYKNFGTRTLSFLNRLYSYFHHSNHLMRGINIEHERFPIIVSLFFYQNVLKKSIRGCQVTRCFHVNRSLITTLTKIKAIARTTFHHLQQIFADLITWLSFWFWKGKKYTHAEMRSIKIFLG